MEQAKQRRQKNLSQSEGRDELNLAEFPIASLSSRPNKNLKTLHFEDRIWDKSRGARITRQLTISASDKYGLPTALDDEVILGLIQLSREDAFQSRRVFFSRYRLIRLLGWRNEGKSYTRLETSLKRWIGVAFYYENAWWDKTKQSWVDESFHILERLSMYDRRRRSQRVADSEPALSMFSWNEVVFRSFRSGYLKQIDMELFRRLKSPIAKRLYRLLDKRFYHKARWEFDLREFACEHVGLSRNYDIGGLKRKLRPAIAELELTGYLKRTDPESRFQRVGRGRWQVSFVKGTTPRCLSKRREASGDVKAKLLEHGVNLVTAERLVADHSTEEIQKQIEVFDWLLGHGNHRAPRNPAGYLVQSIRNGYDIPKGFSEANGQGARCKRPSGGFGKQPPRQKTSNKSGESRQARLDRYLRSLAPEKRKRLEEDAIASADSLLGSAYGRALAEGNELLADVYRCVILEKHLAGLRESSHTDRGRGK